MTAPIGHTCLRRWVIEERANRKVAGVETGHGKLESKDFDADYTKDKNVGPFLLSSVEQRTGMSVLFFHGTDGMNDGRHVSTGTKTLGIFQYVAQRHRAFGFFGFQ